VCAAPMRATDGVVRAFAAAIAIVAAAACVPRTEAPSVAPLDPDATFAAHAVHGGLAIDRFAGDRTGRIDARGFGWFMTTFVVRVDGATVATVWLVAPATVTAESAAPPATLAVEPSWTDQAIRFSLRDGAGVGFRTGPFVRIDGGAGMPVLSRTGQTNLDARGTYRAEIVRDDGVPAGWFEVRVPSPDAPRLFAGVLPAAPVAAGPALAVALGSELDWIDAHVIDVYRGIGRGRDGGAQGR
jgi:hypothetical protein